MKTLITKVFQWGMERDIYKYSSVSTQLVKLIEEFFEYQDAKSKYEYFEEKAIEIRKEIDDAKGDMLIVAINLFGVSEYKEGMTYQDLASRLLDENLRSDEIKEVAKLGQESLEDLIKYTVKNMVRNKMTPLVLVYALITHYGLETYPLLSASYDVIKDRKGKLTTEGNFVKEEDLK